MTRYTAIDVRCPDCDAPPGERCRWMDPLTGKPTAIPVELRHAHLARRVQAQKVSE